MNKLYGNAVIGQSGGPTAAINATLSGVVRGCKDADCIGKIYGAINGIEGVLAERFCDLGEKLPDEASLRLGRLADDIALSAGAGIRYDLDFFVIRLDWGFILHAPYDTGKSGYFNTPSFKNAQCINFAIGYPF